MNDGPHDIDHELSDYRLRLESEGEKALDGDVRWFGWLLFIAIAGAGLWFLAQVLGMLCR